MPKAKSKSKRTRKPRTGKRVANTTGGSDGTRQMAIDFALTFLRLIVGEERMALARVGRKKAGEFHAENRILAMLTSVATCKSFVASPPEKSLVDSVGAYVARYAALICRAIPDDFRRHMQALTFEGLERSLTNLRLSGFTLPQAGWTEAEEEAWSAEQDAACTAENELKATADALAEKQAKVFGQLLQGAVGESDVRGYVDAGKQLKAMAEDSAMNDPAPVFSSATKVREEISRRMGLSRNTVLKLARETKREKPAK